MKKIHVILLMVTLMFISACSIGPSVCDNREDSSSKLCEMADSLGVKLEDAGNILMIANMVAIDSGSYTRSQAVVVLSEILDLVNSSPSYLFLGQTVLDEAQRYPGLFIVAGHYLSTMSSTQIISRFDRGVLSSWLKNQIAILGG